MVPVFFHVTGGGALSVVPGEEPPLYARVDFLFDDEGDALVNELEVIEPMLFFQHRPEAASIFADAILGACGS